MPLRVRKNDKSIEKTTIRVPRFVRGLTLTCIFRQTATVIKRYDIHVRILRTLRLGFNLQLARHTNNIIIIMIYIKRSCVHNM